MGLVRYRRFMPDPSAAPGLPPVRGVEVDPQTRCRHWHSRRDILAIRFPCCDTYWACIDCHRALAGHPETRRSIDDSAPALLCGACGHQMTVRQYLDCNNACPACGHGFNPGCRNHHHLYFS